MVEKCLPKFETKTRCLLVFLKFCRLLEYQAHQLGWISLVKNFTLVTIIAFLLKFGFEAKFFWFLGPAGRIFQNFYWQFGHCTDINLARVNFWVKAHIADRWDIFTELFTQGSGFLVVMICCTFFGEIWKLLQYLKGVIFASVNLWKKFSLGLLRPDLGPKLDNYSSYNWF